MQFSRLVSTDLMNIHFSYNNSLGSTVVVFQIDRPGPVLAASQPQPIANISRGKVFLLPILNQDLDRAAVAATERLCNNLRLESKNQEKPRADLTSVRSVQREFVSYFECVEVSRQ